MRVAVYPLQLWRLSVEAASILIVCLRRSHGRGGIGLGRLVDGGVCAIHWCGCCHKIRGF